MSTWLLTLHGPDGPAGSVQTGETQFVVGTETAPDVYTVTGTGVAARHAWMWIGDAGLQVEALGGETFVNGHAISERVQVEYPASVQVGEVTLTVEVHETRVEEVSPPVETIPVADVQPSNPGSPLYDIAITIPTKSARSAKPQAPAGDPALAETIPATRSGPIQAVSRPSNVAKSNDAPLQGKYTLVREIARGGMGQIHLGEDALLKRQVAVKVSSLAQGGEDPRFAKEAEVLAQLAHPNIVPIHAKGTDAQGRPFYSMKLITGRTLQAVLNALRAGDPAVVREYPTSTLLTIFRKVCDAMAFAHSKRILHRDLKPENIMVGEYGEVLVMDWGLAKMLGSGEVPSAQREGSTASFAESGSVGMTLEGDVMGTPQYMSPEQAEGMVAELDERSDIYSLGGILFALLTLRPPVEGKSVKEVLTKVRNGEVSSMISQGSREKVEVGTPAAMDRRVPDALQAVTRKAMSRDREQRYAGVEELAADIDAYQSGFATRAERAGVVKQIALFIKRHRAFSSMVAVFLLAAVAFVWRLTLSERRALENERTSRLSAAAAQVALAEAAEETADSERMRDALLKVPPELRDSDWEYLDKRSDYADLQIHAPGKSPWKSVIDCPGEPEQFIAMQTTGELYRLDAQSGKLTALWKAESPGFTSQSTAHVSPDGSRIGISWNKGPLQKIEVRNLQSGTLLGSIPVVTTTESKVLTAMLLNQGTLVFHTRKTSPPFEGSAEGWNVDSGEKLWEKPQIRYIQSGTSAQSVLALNPEGTFFQLNAATGEQLSGMEITLDKRLIPNMDHCALSGHAGSVVNLLNNTVRKIDGKTGAVLWQSQCQFTTPLALRLGQSSYIFGALGRRSMLGSVFEIRTQDGVLIKAAPFQSKVGVSKIARSKDAFAISVGERILVWHARQSPISRGVSIAYQPHHPFVPIADGTSIACAEYTPKEGHRLGLWSVEATRSKSQKTASLPLEGLSVNHHATLFANPHGTHVLLLLEDKVSTFRVREGQIEPVLKAQKLPFAFPPTTCTAAVHPSGDRFLCGGKIFDFASGRELVSLQRPTFIFARTNAQRCSGGWLGNDHCVQLALFKTEDEENADERRNIVVSDARTGDIVAQVSTPTTTTLAASSNGALIAEGGTDKRIRIRDGKTLRIEREFRAHDAVVEALVWHPKRPLLVSAEKGRIRIWNTQTWKMMEELNIIGSRDEIILDVSGDGRSLIVSRNSVDYYEPASFRVSWGGGNE